MGSSWELVGGILLAGRKVHVVGVSGSGRGIVASPRMDCSKLPALSIWNLGPLSSESLTEAIQRSRRSRSRDLSIRIDYHESFDDD